MRNRRNRLLVKTCASPVAGPLLTSACTTLIAARMGARAESPFTAPGTVPFNAWPAVSLLYKAPCAGMQNKDGQLSCRRRRRRRALPCTIRLRWITNKHKQGASVLCTRSGVWSAGQMQLVQTRETFGCLSKFRDCSSLRHHFCRPAPTWPRRNSLPMDQDKMRRKHYTIRIPT